MNPISKVQTPLIKTDANLPSVPFGDLRFVEASHDFPFRPAAAQWGSVLNSHNHRITKTCTVPGSPVNPQTPQLLPLRLVVWGNSNPD